MRLAIAAFTLSLTAFPAWSDTPTAPAAPAKKTAKKKTARKKVPVVAVSPAVRHAALEAVSARASTPSDTLEDAVALVPVFQQISPCSRNGPVRILQYGDSHTASDDWADEMRQDFQRKFGAGGPGFTLPGHPFLGYRRFDSRGASSRGWYTDGLATRQGDGVYGLGGISLTAHAPGQTVSLSVECQQLRVDICNSPVEASWNFPWMARRSAQSIRRRVCARDLSLYARSRSSSIYFCGR